MFLPSIQEIQTKNLTWINISRVSPEEMKYLEENFHFHQLHLADCLNPAQRPKLDVGKNYLFIVLTFPIYHRKTRQIISSEVDFFIGTNFLVTVHRNELTPLINFFNLCQISKSQQKKYFTGNPSVLLHKILDCLFSHCDPILETLQSSIDSIEENIFRGYERRMVKEILLVKRNIINFRRIMQAHESVIDKFIAKCELLFSIGQFTPYFLELKEKSGDIWDTLENLYQSIITLEQTNNSLISFRINDIIKILTTISVIILPITLIANIFSMNTRGIPFIDEPNSFWIVLGLMSIVFISLLIYFKSKKWL